MKNFFQIAAGVDVLPLAMSLHLHPELWNEHKERLHSLLSPHREASDIWVRYNDFKHFNKDDPGSFNAPHFAVWYPAYRYLHAINPIVYGLMSRLQATALGGVLITRIPAGRRIFAHIDSGWHADFYNCKAHIPLQTNDKCISYADGEQVVMHAGDVWRMDNTVEHCVVNDGDDDRITLIVCMRVE